MADDQQTPTEPGEIQTDAERPLGREFALQATLHEVFDVGEKPTKTIARYQIEGRLGAGGMSEVFLATDPELRRRVAVKVLNQRFAADQQERLLREGWALASVTHPNVVAVYDVGFDRGRAFLVMEHVEGTTLDVWLAAAPRSLPELLTLLIRVADGLAVVHERGVIHRDLKPQNIIVDPDGAPKVIDFGLVVGDGWYEAPTTAETEAEAEAPRTEATLSRGEGLAGTVAYMSPEQALSSARLDARSDLFSLAIVTYEAVFGARPFAGRGPALLTAIVTQPPRRPTMRLGLRARMLWRALRRALAKDPAARIQDMRGFAAALQRVLARPRSLGLTAAFAASLTAAALVGLVGLPELRYQQCVKRSDGAWPRLAAAPAGPLRSRFERYAESWSQTWREGCAATHREGALSVDVGLAQREACLREAEGIVEEALDQLEPGDADGRERLLLAEPPSLAACTAGPSIRGRRAHALRESAAVEGVAEAIKGAEVRYFSGDLEEAERLGREAVARAEEVEHRWSRARARLVLGKILRRAEAPAPQATVAGLEAAANDAIADRDRLLAIEALHEAARAAVLLVPDAAEAGSLLRRAEAELAALDDLPLPLGPQLRASQHDIRGLIDYEGGAYEAAREAHRAAIDELRGLAEVGKLDDEGRRLLAAAYLNLSRVLDDAPARERALDEAHALMIQLYGSDHPGLAVHLYSQGLAAFDAGRPVLARELAEASLLLARDAGSGAPLQTARAELLLSQLNLHRGDFEAALRLATYAEERLPAPGGNDLLQARRLRALSLRSLERHADAERIEAALVAQAREDPSLSARDREDVLLDRAAGMYDEGRFDEALDLVDALERSLNSAPLPPSALAIRGWALARAGREKEAIFPLERGIETLTSGHQQNERALSEWILAEALIAVDGDRRRICELFAASRGFYSAQEGSEATVAELDELLAQQGCSSPDTHPPKVTAK